MALPRWVWLLGGAAVACAGGGSTCIEDPKPAGPACPNVTYDEGSNGGWKRADADSALDTDVCTIERRHINDLSAREFAEYYWDDRPVVLEGFDRNRETTFPAMCARDTMLAFYGTLPIVLSSANKNSYEKKTITLAEYVAEFMKAPPVVKLGKTTWYHFGNNDHAAWPELFECYQRPTEYMKDPDHYAYSFGIGAGGTGVPFHTHGPVFNEVVFGRKRWWLKPPGPEPAFEGDESALQWLYRFYARGVKEAREGVLECVLGPGEVLFVPGMWHHSTLNIGDTIFMATFV
eukprot:TRINITY_DN11621_c0_g1_i1.p3 TRINITY_DN11621_c0_g1~~TRINITY_DN11621_c0_g1_i1.p3  ORF type:complete len:290 (+),score=90.43 TRINITY_DN11621_c0_g1_i1:51-920(+)